MTLSPPSWNILEVYGRQLIQCSSLQKWSSASWVSLWNSPLLGYYSNKRHTLKPFWKSIRMSLLRGREPQQEGQSILTKMLSHHPRTCRMAKRAQRILGALLWLSTRTRPDIACAVSLAVQSLWYKLDHLKIRLRHLLQYLNTTKTFGLLYTFPQKEQPSTLSEFTVFADSSFAPSRKHSQTGYVILLSFGNVRHLIHWHSSC